MALHKIQENKIQTLFVIRVEPTSKMKLSCEDLADVGIRGAEANAPVGTCVVFVHVVDDE